MVSTLGGQTLAIWCALFASCCWILLYPTDLLRQDGYREPPRTWDELEIMAARIQASERAKGKKQS